MKTTPQRKPIIEPYEVNDLSRPCDAEESVVKRIIEESELLDIKSQLGDALFLRLTTDADCMRLLEGGEYTNENGSVRVFAGLKRTVAYYVWARLVKSSVNHLTRFGYVVKNDDHSHQSEYKERQTAYNDAFAVADGYMKECFAYMQANPSVFADYTPKGKVTANRVKYRVIGE